MIQRRVNIHRRLYGDFGRVAPPGFTLLETVAWLGLLGIVASISMPLFRTTFRILRDTEESQSADIRRDVAIGQLRQDIWAAQSITQSSPHSIRLHLPTGQTIAWTANLDSDSLVRWPTDTEYAQHWEGFAGAEFNISGPMLIVHLHHDANRSDEHLALVSQTMLLGKSK